MAVASNGRAWTDVRNEMTPFAYSYLCTYKYPWGDRQPECIYPCVRCDQCVVCMDVEVQRTIWERSNETRCSMRTNGERWLQLLLAVVHLLKKDGNLSWGSRLIDIGGCNVEFELRLG